MLPAPPGTAVGARLAGRVPGAAAGAAEEIDPPPPAEQVHIPLAGPDEAKVRVNAQAGKVSVVARDAPLSEVLSLLADAVGLNVVFADSVTAKVTITLHNVRLADA